MKASLPLFNFTFDHPFSVCKTLTLYPSNNFPTTFDSVVGFSRTFNTSVVTIVSALADVVKIPRPKTAAVAIPINFFIIASIAFVFVDLIIATIIFLFAKNIKLQSFRNGSLIFCNNSSNILKALSYSFQGRLEHVIHKKEGFQFLID